MSLLVALGVALALQGPPQTHAPRALLLTGAHVLGPDGAQCLENKSISIAGGRIDAVANAGELHVANDVERIDCAGLYVIPGLIDLHTHLLLHPYDETPWDRQVLEESLELRTIRATVQARATLAAGFTTVRELGTEGAGFADVALRDAIASGLVDGPRVFASTRAIVATGCYGPSGFDPRWEVPKGAQEADGVDGVRVAVREQIAAGADWIKFYADYRRARGAAATPTFTLDEMKAIVDEATSAGIAVAAHASTDEGARRAVLAGVATIEHGTELTEDTLRAMKEHGTVLVPTLAANEAVSRYAGWKAGDDEPARLRHARETFRRARELGVTIANGSDAGVFAHGTNARELELLVEYGMKPGEALKSATTTAARVLRRERELGSIAPGFAADLVALAADPLADVAALRKVELVVARGRVVAGVVVAGKVDTGKR